MTWGVWFLILKYQSWGLTREELGPGSSPFVSGVSESLRFRSSENSWVTGVCGCCGVRMEDVLGRDWAMASLGSSSVMSSQDYRRITEKQLWNSNNAFVQSCVNTASLWLAKYDVDLIFSHRVQVPGLHVLILQVFTNVASWTENTMCFLMDLPLLIVTFRLRNNIAGEKKKKT